MGPQGPPGIGDLSKCEYQRKTKENVETALTETYAEVDDVSFVPLKVAKKIII